MLGYLRELAGGHAALDRLVSAADQDQVTNFKQPHWSAAPLPAEMTALLTACPGAI